MVVLFENSLPIPIHAFYITIGHRKTPAEPRSGYQEGTKIESLF